MNGYPKSYVPGPMYGPAPLLSQSNSGWGPGWFNQVLREREAQYGPGANNFFTSPTGLAVGMGLNLLGGIFGGIAKGKRDKRMQQQLQQMQRAYQQKAAQLFPELPKESFQYQNPAMNNAITAALMYRMSNMFPTWGMPPNMRGGQGNLTGFFNAAMPQMPQASTGPALPPARPRQPINMKPGPDGGWYADYKRKQYPPPMAY